MSVLEARELVGSPIAGPMTVTKVLGPAICWQCGLVQAAKAVVSWSPWRGGQMRAGFVTTIASEDLWSGGMSVEVV